MILNNEKKINTFLKIRTQHNLVFFPFVSLQKGEKKVFTTFTKSCGEQLFCNSYVLKTIHGKQNNNLLYFVPFFTKSNAMFAKNNKKVKTAVVKSYFVKAIHAKYSTKLICWKEKKIT